MIAPFAQADSFRTLDYGFTYDDFWNSYTDGDYSNKHVKMGLKRFVNRRVESLKEELKYYVAKPFVYLIKAVPKNLTLKDSVRIDASIFSNPEITSAIVKVKNNTTGIEKSYSLQKCGVTSTKLVEEFDKWSVVLPPLNKGENEVSVFVTNTAGLSATFPRGPKFFLNVSDTTKSPLVINEFLAINDKTNPDEYGEYDDWVEIFNRGESEIDLGGYFLTDSKGKLSKWQFPQGTVISPNGFLLVWCDKDNQAGLHTNFKLSGSGEFVALVSADGTTVLDSISFGKQTADVSSGRFPDGGEEWKFLKPTPNQPNVLLRVRNKFQPSTFSLSIFPNPVVASENGSVKVEYSLSGVKLANRKYSLAVFNALGQKVKTLRNGIAVAGKQTFSYDISKLASGVYFVVLKIGSRIKTQKFLLLR